VKGHIRERSPGHWAIVLDVIDPASGKKRRKWYSFTGAKRQAQAECARLITAQGNGVQIDPGRITVAQYLTRWLAHVETQVSPSSHATYSTIIRSYVLPVIGASQLKKLRPEAIASLYATALKSGARQRRCGLSAKSVGLLHRLLSQALHQAVRWQLLPVNPAAAVAPPRVERKTMVVPDTGAVLDLVEAARDTDLFAPVLITSMTGLRRSEALALRWEAIDVDEGKLEVKASIEQVGTVTRIKIPKSGKGRNVALPALLIEELRRYRLTQAEDLLRLGVRQDGDTHVCTRADGSPWRPSAFTQAFTRFLRALKRPHMRFHDLRHAHATHMLDANVHPKIVQERLGHSSISLTLDLYSHTTPGMQKKAAASIDSMMRAARSKGRRGRRSN
jgi:integrase